MVTTSGRPARGDPPRPTNSAVITALPASTGVPSDGKQPVSAPSSDRQSRLLTVITCRGSKPAVRNSAAAAFSRPRWTPGPLRMRSRPETRLPPATLALRARRMLLELQGLKGGRSGCNPDTSVLHRDDDWGVGRVEAEDEGTNETRSPGEVSLIASKIKKALLGEALVPSGSS